MTTTRPDTTGSSDKLAYTIAETAQALSIGRSTLYKLIQAGELPSVSIGARRVILREDLNDFVNARRQTAPTEVV